MMPLPVVEQDRWLPGSACRYSDLQRVYYSPYSQNSVWRGVRTVDQLPVALKRMAEDLWTTEKELSMHLAASGVPGACLCSVRAYVSGRLQTFQLYLIPSPPPFTCRCRAVDRHVLGSASR
jgi:hypothetical protein